MADKQLSKQAQKIAEMKRDPIKLMAEGAIAPQVNVIKEFDTIKAEHVEVIPEVAEVEAIEIEVNEHHISAAEAEILFKYLLGEKLSSALDVLYQGRSVPKLGGFRRSLHEVFENGGFVIDPVSPKAQPRTGNDENHLHPTYRRLRALIGYEALVRLQDYARPLRLSNVSTLQIGIKAALDRLAL